MSREKLENELQRVQSEYINRSRQVWDNAYKSNVSISDEGASARRAAEYAISSDYELQSLKRKIDRLQQEIDDLDPAVIRRK
ncbi:MAG: hypothetical protein LBC71_04965 [Oscillospiraceae bacterium]|nr:hypothetical protein [Oscillospiraceae bacterium]